VNQEESEQNEVDGMKKGADSTGEVTHKMTDRQTERQSDRQTDYGTVTSIPIGEIAISDVTYNNNSFQTPSGLKPVSQLSMGVWGSER